ncbi:hypothetical protein L6164_014778 [Bauhinia variegata]|uniref:Uncharacterized protein n=1 Tax=Bauhinia variegata TaxID=167791 RepID=A0ACB9NJU6_BAUVA|nr:hypothetical protein L6164_014778 [Bauhinia variegata]
MSIHCHRILKLRAVKSLRHSPEKVDLMDFDFRASTIHSAKHLSAARLHTDKDKSWALDSDSTDDPGSLFSCPICDFDVELPVLCSHLQEEHCFDLKNAVCPLCAANLGKDPVEHLTLQHPCLVKRRRKSDKPSIWYGTSAMLGKKLATDSRGNKHESAPDPLLSPFLCNVSVPNPNTIRGEELSIRNAPVISDASSSGTNALYAVDEQDHQERRERAAFIQQLVASTIL